MRTCLKREWIYAFALFAFFSLAFGSKGLADDAGKSSDSTKTDTDTTVSTTAANKPVPVSPAPGLTEREQWLLHRVEQLEKRVEELEAKEHAGSRSATPANATVAANGHAGTPAGAPGNSAAPATTAAGNVANSGVPVQETFNPAPLRPSSPSRTNRRQHLRVQPQASRKNRSSLFLMRIGLG